MPKTNFHTLQSVENKSAWPDIEPLLDDAMTALDETDRSAILLRYFENKTLREVGESLGRIGRRRTESASAAPWNACANFSRNAT